jgi:hypothetical protein
VGSGFMLVVNLDLSLVDYGHWDPYQCTNWT